MKLITSDKDDRLSEIRFAEWPEWSKGRLYHDSLIAALARVVALEEENKKLREAAIKSTRIAGWRDM